MASTACGGAPAKKGASGAIRFPKSREEGTEMASRHADGREGGHFHANDILDGLLIHFLGRDRSVTSQSRDRSCSATATPGNRCPPVPPTGNGDEG